jgi:titin
VPSSPEGPLNITEITETSVTISWKKSRDDGGLPITLYVIERRDARFTSWLRVDAIKPSISSYCIQNLVEGNEYLFRVYAENKEGSSEPLVSVEGVIPHREPGAGEFCIIALLIHYNHVLSS